MHSFCVVINKHVPFTNKCTSFTSAMDFRHNGAKYFRTNYAIINADSMAYRTNMFKDLSEASTVTRSWGGGEMRLKNLSHNRAGWNLVHLSIK